MKKFFGAALFLLVFLATEVSATVLVSYTHRPLLATRTILFIHGLTSNARASWTNESNGTYWPDIVAGDSSTSSYAVAVMDYKSSLYDGQRIEVIADSAINAIKANVPATHDLIIIGHSLGGIIARELILKSQDIALRVKKIITFATPMGGSRLADIASWFGILGPIVIQLTPNVDSNYLAALLNRWVIAQQQLDIPVFCSAEGANSGTIFGIRGTLIVDQVSASLEMQ